jgi:hypothetical protein
VEVVVGLDVLAGIGEGVAEGGTSVAVGEVFPRHPMNIVADTMMMKSRYKYWSFFIFNALHYGV